MYTRKSRKAKHLEYEEKYKGIPLDYKERLNWLYEKLNISESQAYNILYQRDSMLNTLQYYQTLIVLYEEPEGSPRPRFRIVNRKNLSNMAISNPNFIHVYSLTGKEDNQYMKRLINEEIMQIDGIICTPSIVDMNLFFKTPTYFNKSETILAEIGLERPIYKPDWDNAGKKYSDMFNENIWLDDAFTIEGTVRKFYSVLPRVEIRIKYLNMLYNKYQYNSVKNRTDYDESYNVQYYGG